MNPLISVNVCRQSERPQKTAEFNYFADESKIEKVMMMMICWCSRQCVESQSADC